jgi:homoserine dehydrogenase
VLFSEAVLEAWRAGLMERDPRDDLHGTEMAMKLLVLGEKAPATSRPR